SQLFCFYTSGNKHAPKHQSLVWEELPTGSIFHDFHIEGQQGCQSRVDILISPSHFHQYSWRSRRCRILICHNSQSSFRFSPLTVLKVQFACSLDLSRKWNAECAMKNEKKVSSSRNQRIQDHWCLMLP